MARLDILVEFLKNVAWKVSFLKENHVFLFASIISWVKCHMGGKISGPMHNLKKKLRTTLHLNDNDAFIYGHFMCLNCPQEMPVRSGSN